MKSFLKAFLITLLILALLIGGIVFFLIKPAFDDMHDGEDAEEIARVLDKREGDSYNVLMLGVDGGGKRTDTIMLLSVQGKEVHITSIPRDTRVKIGKNHQKINAALPTGGVPMLVEAVREVTGAPIHYYAKVDFDGFVEIIDQLGGVDFDVPQDMQYSDPAQGLEINLKQGYQHLNGEQAIQLCRFRKYPTADIGRTQVQQQFIKAVIDQKLNLGNLFKLPGVVKSVGEHVETNFQMRDLFSLIGIGDVQLHQMPGEGKYIGKVSYFVQNKSETYAMFEQYFLGTGEPAEKVYTA